MTIIRHAVRKDLLALANLLDDVDKFYGDPEAISRDEKLKGIEEALFASPPSAFALLAWGQSAIVGLAAYSFLWPAAGVSRSLYLKELYVVAESRRLGVGTDLMKEVFRVARAYRCSRVEWATEVGNADAQSFYIAIGAGRMDDKVSYRVTL